MGSLPTKTLEFLMLMLPHHICVLRKLKFNRLIGKRLHQSQFVCKERKGNEF